MMENTSDFFASIPADADDVMDMMERIGGHSDGYCELYRYDKAGRFRTLKCLQPAYRGKPLYENLLRKEFEIGYSLSHPHICEYYEWKTHPMLGACIEMEWVDGRTLDRMLEEGRQPREVYDKIVAEICDALGYMHSKQVLHKDLKPSNILITYNGNNVKIIDFGLSDSDSSSVLKIPAGTAAFAAPEVLMGGKASVRSDLYSLGMVLSVFPVRKYATAIRRLCAASPEKRPGSVHETMRLLKRSTSAIPGIVFIFLAVAFTVWMLVNPSRMQDGADPAVPAADTTAMSSAAAPPADAVVTDSAARPAAATIPAAGPTATERPSAHSRPSASPSAQPAPSQDQPSPQGTPVDPSLLDEVFLQATGMFEE